MPAPRKIDYERIEPGWRAGILSPQQLATDYTEQTGVSVSHTAIIKHFRKLGIPRDLAAKVRAKADAMVAESMVTGKVSRETTVSEAKVIEDSAEQIANIRLSHRKDIRRGRDIVGKLLAELEYQTDNRDLYEQLAEIVIGADEDMGTDAGRKRAERQREVFQKAIALGGRAGTTKSLVESMRTLIGLEREAFGLGQATGSTGSIEDFLESMKAP